jgi:hypothetical protein|tara:strand:+ start:90 stop:539 length:450 start_codon:yes stop_codon:yes gene_type:complete
MNNPDNKEDAFSGTEIVAVIGGTVDSSGNLNENVKVCRVIQVGENDILVRESGAFTERTQVVPKSLCIPINISYERLVTSQVADPCLGDLVMFYGKLDWKDKSSSQIAGILCELVYNMGRPIKAKILSDGEMKEVEFQGLLVLQKKYQK